MVAVANPTCFWFNAGQCVQSAQAVFGGGRAGGGDSGALLYTVIQGPRLLPSCDSSLL